MAERRDAKKEVGSLRNLARTTRGGGSPSWIRRRPRAGLTGSRPQLGQRVRTPAGRRTRIDGRTEGRQEGSGIASKSRSNHPERRFAVVDKATSPLRTQGIPAAARTARPNAGRTPDKNRWPNGGTPR